MARRRHVGRQPGRTDALSGDGVVCRHAPGAGWSSGRLTVRGKRSLEAESGAGGVPELRPRSRARRPRGERPRSWQSPRGARSRPEGPSDPG
jgi:hypothetical protein